MMGVSPPPPPNTCSNCLYFDQIGDGTGKCRAKSPIAVVGSTMAAWPIVQLTDWCGEWTTQIGGNFP